MGLGTELLTPLTKEGSETLRDTAAMIKRKLLCYSISTSAFVSVDDQLDTSAVILVGQNFIT